MMDGITSRLIMNKDVNYNQSSLEAALKARNADYSKYTHLAYNTIFDTVQGEAPFAGYPAIFLRLSGCNRGAKLDRGCNFCDTFFAVGSSNVEHTDKLMRVIEDKHLEAIAKRLQPLSLNRNTQHKMLLVISGGEPMLQVHGLTTFLAGNLDKLKMMFSGIQFESNGDYHYGSNVREFIEFLVRCNEEDDGFFSIVCSPKGKNAPYNDEDAVLPYSFRLKGLLGDPHVYYRFLVATEDLYDGAYYDVPKAITNIMHRDNMFVSPITVYKNVPVDKEITKIETDIDLEATRANVQLAIARAYQYGLKVSFQAHSYIGFA
jgi:7-carboxy-7-deazaguanine synthase